MDEIVFHNLNHSDTHKRSSHMLRLLQLMMIEESLGERVA